MVDINVNSEPGSMVAIRIVDKSVDLMGNENELTSDKIKSQLSTLKP